MNSIYRFTIFKSDPFGNGADKRTAQISEILNEEGLKWNLIPSGFNSITFSYYYFKKCFRTILLFIKIIFIIKKPFHPLTLYRTICFVTQFKGVFSISGSSGNGIIFWESTKMEYSFVLPIFKKKGYKIIGLPHNIESLVPDQRSAITNKITPYWIIDEIRLLKECEVVFSISKEETLFLRQCGIKAEYLPYYPTKEVVDKLLATRKKRIEREIKQKTRKKILMIGSAVNPPTRLGMADRINFFKEANNIICDILVAGYGTESLKSMTGNLSNLIFLGEISNDFLFTLLTSIDAILIHQPPTSGALTRIIEFLIAGVPVLANFNSARDYYGRDGIYLYYDDEHLIKLINANLTMPLCPSYPQFEVNKLRNKLKQR